MASKLHNTEVEVEIVKTKDECDHVQFLITERSGSSNVQHQQVAEIETLSLGKRKFFKRSFYKFILRII